MGYDLSQEDRERLLNFIESIPNPAYTDYDVDLEYYNDGKECCEL